MDKEDSDSFVDEDDSTERKSVWKACSSNWKCTRFFDKELEYEGIITQGEKVRVMKARIPLFGICAVKYVNALNRFSVLSDTRRAYREMFASQMLTRHPNVVRFYGTVYDEANNDIGFVQEFMEGGNLVDVINKSTTLPFGVNEADWIKRATLWAIQIARALAFCHSKNVIHGDVKPENTLLSEDLLTIKLGDFGVSVASEDIACSTVRGTLIYMAPEMIQGLNSVSEFGSASDVFSYAMFLFTMFYRRLPFMSQTNMSEFAYLCGLLEDKRPLISKTIPEEIRIIIQDCWKGNPVERATMKEVVERLENYWMLKYPDEKF